ncbi:hypothetical protein ACHAW6_005025, partial [Cyclotella cf. meneghiniana]
SSVAHAVTTRHAPSHDDDATTISNDATHANATDANGRHGRTPASGAGRTARALARRVDRRQRNARRGVGRRDRGRRRNGRDARRRIHRSRLRRTVGPGVARGRSRVCGGVRRRRIRRFRHGSRVSTADDLPLDPRYEFSPLSRTYGCIQTPAADLAPPAFPPDLYERGLKHFASGEISAAVLCFESTLRNVDSEHADAWRMLGKCHTENDADSKAIACWIKSLERDPYCSETLLALVVAYVNELDWEKAVETLRLWVANHPLYAGMEGGVLEGEEDLYGMEMKDVERLLLRALKFNHDDDAAADVYEALGVVYNVSRDYDAAVDAFRRAITVRPNDYQLRNKVGATLANSNRSEEALPEYTIALKLKPKYARGWLNMAISHSNLRNYSQAARCYLQTLSLNPEAKHVWSYLRIALTCDEKWDLLPLAASQNLSAFHEHFDFVEY